MTIPSSLEPGRVVAGRYRVERKIGDGGMGAVYEVRHVRTDERLAMKVLHAHVLKDQTAVERFRREARAPAQIDSEHVARVTDADTAPDLDDAPFFVMELLRGRDLESILTEEGPIPPPVVVEYLRQAARALDKAHAMGIVHRDLKPENLFLTVREDESPCIKLLDFGIARLADPGAPEHMKTQVGFVFGTPMYMSPEQTTGNVDEVGPASDIWALGLVAFQLLVARDFWNAQTLAQLYARILSERIPAPSARGSTLGPPFDDWFARCVARDPSARFATAGEAVAALASVLGVPLRPSRPAAPLSSVKVAAAATAYGVGPPPGPPASSAPAPPATAYGLGVAAVTPAAPAPSAAPPERSSSAAAPSALVDEVEGVLPKSRSKHVLLGGGALVAIVVAGVLAFATTRASQPSAPGHASRPRAASSSAPSATASEAPGVTANAAPSESAGLVAIASSAPADLGPRAPAPARSARGSAAEKPELSREQRRRLEALQRLCDQGTFTAVECAAKRQAILRGQP